MEKYSALAAMSALSQSTRMDVFRLLVRHEPDGMSAGELANTLGVANNTLSAHLSILTRASLVSPTREGRRIRYRADLGQIQNLLLYLLQDCCGGHPELCASLVNCVSECNPGQAMER